MTGSVQTCWQTLPNANTTNYLQRRTSEENKETLLALTVPAYIYDWMGGDPFAR